MATVAQIRGKVEQLMQQHQALQQELAALQKENFQLKEQLQTLGEEKEELDNKINTLQFAKSIDTEERTALKQKISEYIREIDKCIALLND